MIRRRRKAAQEAVETDLEILPLMNLFVVLIPMLLLSAVFIEMAAIRMHLPSDHDVPAASETNALGLRIAIEETQWVVRGRSLPAQVVARGTGESEQTLRATLNAIVSAHAGTCDVVVVSEPTTHYDDIVFIMDVSRETGLDNVSLTAVNMVDGRGT